MLTISNSHNKTLEKMNQTTTLTNPRKLFSRKARKSMKYSSKNKKIDNGKNVEAMTKNKIVTKILIYSKTHPRKNQ